MAKLIRVGVVRRGDCKNLVLRFQDAVSGKWTCSTKYIDPQSGEVTMTGNDRRFAKKLAILWERDLNSGLDQGRNSITWQQFRMLYEDQVLPSLAAGTSGKVRTMFNHVERVLPKVRDGRLSDLTAEALGRLQQDLRGAGRSEFTIAGVLAHLRSALHWAADQGMIFRVPSIRRPKRAHGGKRKMKGRAIVEEELDRMLAAVPSALGEWQTRRRQMARRAARRKGLKEHHTTTDSVPVEIAPATVESWRHYILGLWLSGLRLTELMLLSWDRDDRPRVDLSEEFPLLRIPAEMQKADRDTLTTIPPDFYTFLDATPAADRHGPVFFPTMPSGNRATGEQAGRMISLLGELARVVVHTHPRTGRVKYASAHDLRRAYGTRWSRVVSASELQDMMRHADYHTTQAYYIDQRAVDLARSVWKKAGVDRGASTVFSTVRPSCQDCGSDAGDVTP